LGTTHDELHLKDESQQVQESDDSKEQCCEEGGGLHVDASNLCDEAGPESAAVRELTALSMTP
jgi:hypothetical protein